ncbi:MAG: class I tRNA ligase family protein, partial [Candidatus Sungbacteria bacterium]|nr:class I tRNA ligase family protein [Candidatus Sungbacteria bacterium]
CLDHQKEPEVIEEENWFFRLSKYAERIEKKVVSDELRVIPESRKNEILSFIKSGLEDVSISRPSSDIPWGVPVPDDSTQTMYVWLEALTNYISSIGYGREDSESVELFQRWWPADAQVVGKDNLRFHAAIWPGMLLSAGLLLPRTLFVHGFVNVDGQKISKTVGNVIAPEEVVKKYGADPVRYYFLREFPSYEDGDFSYKKFEERYNGDLANGLGNLVSRAAALGQNLSPLHFNFEADIDAEIKKISTEVFKSYEGHIAEIRLNEALANLWRLVSFADKYINEKKPWAEKNENELRRTLLNAGYLISTITALLSPFLPESAEKIKTQISIDDSVLKIKKGEALFPRLG